MPIMTDADGTPTGHRMGQRDPYAQYQANPAYQGAVAAALRRVQQPWVEAILRDLPGMPAWCLPDFLKRRQDRHWVEIGRVPDSLAWAELLRCLATYYDLAPDPEVGQR